MTTIKITPGFLLKMMSMARTHDPDKLIAALNLGKVSSLNTASLTKIAEEVTPLQRTKSPSLKPVEAPEAEMGLSFISSGEEALGYIKTFVQERLDLSIPPSELMEIVSNYYFGVNSGRKMSYEQLMHSLLSQSSREEEVSLPYASEESNIQSLRETQEELGYSTKEREGPVPTEEEFQNIPLRLTQNQVENNG